MAAIQGHQKLYTRVKHFCKKWQLRENTPILSPTILTKVRYLNDLSGMNRECVCPLGHRSQRSPIQSHVYKNKALFTRPLLQSVFVILWPTLETNVKTFNWLNGIFFFGTETIRPSLLCPPLGGKLVLHWTPEQAADSKKGEEHLGCNQAMSSFGINQIIRWRTSLK